MAASPLSAAAHPPASLTEWLRARTDTALAELLRRRPDLALPAPADLPTLASRLSVRTSVQRAVDGLDAFVLRVLEALVLTSRREGSAAVSEALGLLGEVDPDELAHGLDELFALALVWGEPDRLHLVNSVRESIGSYPAGLGRPAAQLFAPPSVDVVCPEPMTAPTDALRSGRGLRLVQPGRRFSAQFSVEVG